MSVNEISVNLIANGLKIGVIVSRFNDFLTKELLGGAIDCLVRHGMSEEDITVVWVPGANESPLVANKMAESTKYDAILVLGAVVQGATPHADLINNQVARGLSQVALKTNTPVINGVVCADNLEQAIERSGTKSGNKGWNAAQAGIEMANLAKALD